MLIKIIFLQIIIEFSDYVTISHFHVSLFSHLVVLFNEWNECDIVMSECLFPCVCL